MAFVENLSVGGTYYGFPLHHDVRYTNPPTTLYATQVGGTTYPFLQSLQCFHYENQLTSTTLINIKMPNGTIYDLPGSEFVFNHYDSGMFDILVDRGGSSFDPVMSKWFTDTQNNTSTRIDLTRIFCNMHFSNRYASYRYLGDTYYNVRLGVNVAASFDTYTAWSSSTNSDSNRTLNTNITGFWNYYYSSNGYFMSLYLEGYTSEYWNGTSHNTKDMYLNTDNCYIHMYYPLCDASVLELNYIPSGIKNYLRFKGGFSYIKESTMVGSITCSATNGIANLLFNGSVGP